jgi:soluble lytic murein transglycosylase
MVSRWILIFACIFLSNASQADDAALKSYDTPCTDQLNAAYANLKKGNNPAIPSAKTCPIESKLITWEWLLTSSNGASFEDYRIFLQDNPLWPDQYLLQEKAEGAMTRATPTKDILHFFEKRTPRTMNGLSMYVQALQGSGQKEKAHDWIRKFWHSQKLSSNDESFMFTNYKNILTNHDHLRRVEHLLMREDVYGLQRMAKRMDATHKLFIDVGIGFIKKKSKAQKKISQLPTELQKNSALLYLQIHPFLKHKNDGQKKKQLLDKFAEVFQSGVTHNHPYDWWKIKMICSRLAVEQGRIQEAYAWVKDADVAQDREKMAEIEWLAGWIALRHLKDYPAAQKHFELLQKSVGTPISKAKAAYWLGRTHEALEDESKASACYEQAAVYAHTFYGQRALEKLNKPVVIKLKAKPTIDDNRNPQAVDVLEAIKLIHGLGQAPKTEKFLLHLAKHIPADMVEEIVQLTHDLGYSHLVVLVAKFAGRQAPILIEAAYPSIPLPSLANKNPAMTEALVHSLIRQESGFDKAAKSAPGACGLMQLMPKTAALISKRLGIKFSSRKPQRLVKDHQFNIQLGLYNFDMELKNFGNNVILTLAGYNAGPCRPIQWMKNFGDPRDPKVDWIDWIEQMPFAETRAYVQRILEAVPVYEHHL